MSPELIIYLAFTILVLFACLFIFTSFIVGYYHIVNIENKKDVFYKIGTSIFKREKIWIENVEDDATKKFCIRARILLKVHISLFTIIVLLIMTTILVLGVANK